MSTTIEGLRLEEVDGTTVLDRDGEEIGTVDDLYHDEGTGAPTWVLVKRGWRAGSVLVPLRGAELRDGQLRVPYDKATVDDAPDVDVDARLEGDAEQRLLGHYRTGAARLRAGEGDAAGTSAGRRFRTVDVPAEIVTVEVIDVADEGGTDGPVVLRRQDLRIARRPWQEGDERRQPAPDGVVEIVLTREELEATDAGDEATT